MVENLIYTTVYKRIVVILYLVMDSVQELNVKYIKDIQMVCSCKCHDDKRIVHCAECKNYHVLLREFQSSPGFLIDQVLRAFFYERDETTDKIKVLIFEFDKAEFIIRWDEDKDSFKFTVAPR